MRNSCVLAIFLAVSISILMGATEYVNAIDNPLGTGIFTVVQGPSPLVPCSGPCFYIIYRNNANYTITGVVYGVVHNWLGQTVDYTTYQISPAAGQNATAYLIVGGLHGGTYSAIVFAVTPSGTVISVASTIMFSL